MTRDFGAVPMVDATLDDPTESDTVVRFLDQNADIETSYGGNFVDSIDGYAGSTSGGGDDDWFFFVNGYYSDVGGGETDGRPGRPDLVGLPVLDRGLSGPGGRRLVAGAVPARLRRQALRHRRSSASARTGTCAAVVAALRVVGVEPERREARRAGRASRRAARPRRPLGSRCAPIRRPRQLEAGPGRSGVYARLVRCGSDWRIEPVDSHGQPTGALAQAGLVAAVRQGR